MSISWKAESEHLEHLQHNQTLLRTADYVLLCEQLADPGSTETDVDAVQSSLLYILLSTYIGGDRYMR